MKFQRDYRELFLAQLSVHFYLHECISIDCTLELHLKINLKPSIIRFWIFFIKPIQYHRHHSFTQPKEQIEIGTRLSIDHFCKYVFFPDSFFFCNFVLRYECAWIFTFGNAQCTNAQRERDGKTQRVWEKSPRCKMRTNSNSIALRL